MDEIAAKQNIGAKSQNLVTLVNILPCAARIVVCRN